MTVVLIDKRRPNVRVPCVEMPNGTWFTVLDIQGMEKLVDNSKYCDSATTTPAKAKKIADLIESWNPPPGWINGDDKDGHTKMKGYIVNFMRECNGFRTR